MPVYNSSFEIDTRGHTDVHDVTGRLAEALDQSGLASGLALLFVAGSTAGVTTIENEPGAIRDLRDWFQEHCPEGAVYAHDARWGDGNGFSHLRSALLGPSLAVPFARGKLLLGTWQQAVLVDFDNRPRRRRVIIQIVGE